jgi:hypothetical protein
MSFVKKPCIHCPYRRDVRPFLHLKRGYELARIAQNKYSQFFCHKTLGHDDVGDGDTIVAPESLLCAGFLTMQVNETGAKGPAGFEPSNLAYDSSEEMEAAYEDEAEGCWEKDT